LVIGRSVGCEEEVEGQKKKEKVSMLSREEGRSWDLNEGWREIGPGR
jgi:hypothetical protein